MKKRKNLKSVFVFFIALLILLLLGFPLAVLTGDKQGKVVLDEPIALPFHIEKEKKVILVYFGYAGCQTICTPSLEEIAAIYTEVNASKKVAFYFINIAKEAQGLDAFVQYFHKEFIGVNLSLEQRMGFMNALRAYSSDSLSGDGEMSHTGYLYMIKQEPEQSFELKAMYYTRPFDRKSIVMDIKEEFK
jgi:protein SCO1/2